LDACTGLRVLEAAEGQNTAALCGQLFAGLGATVVKVERAQGDALRLAPPLAPDGTAHVFHLLNASKQSVRLPDDEAAARKRWLELVEWADVVVIEEAAHPVPDVLHAAEFCARWPRKVLCTTSIFGTDTVKQGWRGNELIAEAVSGLMLCTGYPERPPVCCGVPYALHVSALFAFNGIMAALWERERSARGQWLDVSVVGCLVGLLGNFMPSYFLSGRSPKRVGNRHIIAAPWNIYPSTDGHLVICTGTGGTGWWKTITKVIGRPDVTDDPRYVTESKRVENVEEVDHIVAEWTSRHSSKEADALMTKGGIPAGEIAPIEAVLADAHYRDVRALLEWTGKPGDKNAIPLAGLPFKIGNWSAKPRAAPALDEHQPAQGPPSEPAPVPAARQAGGALSGMRVLEFGSRTSVPMAGRILSDLGADVVKIEPPKGEGLRAAGQPVGGSSYIFHINNAGKRSLVIDPADPKGRELILEMASKADVWLENLAPGVLERMGLGYEALKAVNPRIVYCSVSGFGIKSNYGDKKAFDSVVQAASGVMFMTGYPDHLPVKIGISASDLAVGVSLVGAVLAALRHRELTGKGMHVDLAMADIGVWMTQAAWPQVFFGNGHPMRMGNRSANACPHNIFATSDGYVAIAVESDEQWHKLARLCAVPELEDHALASTAGRLANVERIERALSSWVAQRQAEQVAAQCQAAGVPAASVRTLGDIVNDEDVARRKLVIEVEHPIAGKMKLLGNPLRLSRTPAEVTACAPVLGRHSRETLQDWLGAPAQRIDALVRAGVVIQEGAEAESGGHLAS